MFREGHWLESRLNLSRVIFCLASLLIYVVSAWRIHQRRETDSLRDLIPALAASSAGIYLIIHALFISKGDQRGLIFLFVPPLQWIIALALTPFTSPSQQSSRE